jgi:hypothetical protein
MKIFGSSAGPRTAPSECRLVVPAYFHPERSDQWELLAQQADARVRLVILNVANGPGERPDAAFAPFLTRLRDRGVQVAGYVDTNYGRRPERDVLGDIAAHRDWYGVTGVCFDRAAGTLEQLARYAALAASARQLGAGHVLFNHGAYPLAGYAEHAEILGVFEGPWRAYQHVAVPRWARSQPADKFYHVVYAVPAGQYAHATELARRRWASCVYVTDLDGGNPYRRLPAAGFGPAAGAELDRAGCQESAHWALE